MGEAILLVGDSESDQNLYYRTHFLAGDPFVYLEYDGHSEVIVSSMEAGRARKQASVSQVKTFEDYGYRDLVKQLDSRSKAFSALLGRAVEGTGADSLVVESTFPVLFADHLRSDGHELDVDEQLFQKERRQKSAEEIEAIAESQDAAQRATAHAIELIAATDIRDGALYLNDEQLTMERLRAEVEVFLTRLGFDPANPITAGGPGAADPHWMGYGPLMAGESIVLDIFPRSKRTRYWGDITRTVVRGKPNPGLVEMYGTTLQAQQAAFSQIRAGANGKDVHNATQQVFDEAGFGGESEGPRFIHSTGHGVGLGIHEAPGLGMIDNELLPGDVVTVEPGLYDPAIGAVRIEDTVVVTEDGFRNLTTLEKRFELTS
ncbi:MAG: M24 family metallopeptidase [Chloroflexota bacterium]